jgi:hypothetical protein
MKDSKNQIIRSMKSYETGKTLETFQNGGGTKRNARTGKRISGKRNCYERAQFKNKMRKFWNEGAGKTIKGIGKGLGVAGGVIAGGVAAYKKSTPFKNAVDKVKEGLGMQKGGVVKKYQKGGSTDSLKVIKKEGRLAVKTEKQKQAAAKKTAANAKKIAKAKENARLNLEWQKMSKSQKDSLIRQQRSRF